MLSISSINRLCEELAAVDIKVRGIDNDKPVFDTLAPSIEQIAAAVVFLHIPDEEQYLVTDLEQKCSALKALIPSKQWDAYLKVQTDLIKKKRRDIYRDPEEGNDEMVMEAIADGQSFHDVQMLAIQLKGDVQVKHPWPGTYR